MKLEAIMVVLETLLLISLQNIEMSMFTSHSFYQHFEGGNTLKVCKWKLSSECDRTPPSVAKESCQMFHQNESCTWRMLV